MKQKIKVDPTYGRQVVAPKMFEWTSGADAGLVSTDVIEKCANAVARVLEKERDKWYRIYNSEIQDFWRFLAHGIKIDWQLHKGKQLCVWLDGDDFELYGGNDDDIIRYDSIASVVVEKATAHRSPEERKQILSEWKTFLEKELRIIEEGLRDAT